MAHTPDDGFHEIQLNGKQLVFLFMAATVVSVVIFLCGVLVGRGVRAERGTVAMASALHEIPAPDAVASTPQTTGAILAGADPRAAAPPPPADDLSYFNRLEKSNQPAEEFKPAAPRPAEPPTPASTEKSPAAKPAAAPIQPNLPAAVKASKDAASKDTAAKAAAPKAATPKAAASKAAAPKDAAPVSPAPAPATVAPPPTTAVASGPAPAASVGSDGYAVQVAAVNLRSDADAIAKLLATKGYTAYVELPPNSTGTVFRVRVGRFKTRHEAELIAAKLQKEEQIKPWVTR